MFEAQHKKMLLQMLKNAGITSLGNLFHCIVALLLNFVVMRQICAKWGGGILPENARKLVIMQEI